MAGAALGSGAQSLKPGLWEINNKMSGRQMDQAMAEMQQRTGNTMKTAFTCSNPPSSGEGSFTFAGDAYTSHMTINTVVQGKPETMVMDGSGKWLGADCGSIKPVTRRK